MRFISRARFLHVAVLRKEQARVSYITFLEHLYETDVEEEIEAIHRAAQYGEEICEVDLATLLPPEGRILELDDAKETTKDTKGSPELSERVLIL